MAKFINESWLVLTMGVVFAGLLAGTQQTLDPAIKANQRAALLAAIEQVMPPGELAAPVELADQGLPGVYECRDADGRLVGWALDSRGPGFADMLRLVVGLSADGQTITGVKVIEQSETPGLGNKIEDPDWVGMYRGTDATRPLEVTKTKRALEQLKADNQIAAITGATISADAVTDIVNKRMAEVREKLLSRAATAGQE